MLSIKINAIPEKIIIHSDHSESEQENIAEAICKLIEVILNPT